MDVLVDLLLVSLAVSVQLGVPVVVLFVAGYLDHRKSRRHWDQRGPLDDVAELATAPTATKRWQVPDDAVGPSLEFRRCPPWISPSQACPVGRPSRRIGAGCAANVWTAICS